MAAALCASLIATVASPRAAAPPGLDEAVRTFLARQRIPGAAVAVVHRGRIVHAAGYGVANLELGVPASPRTVFEIGSISKQFTAQAVMQLVEAGAVGLDDPIHKFLAVPAGWDGITLRHLLSYTSGLTNRVNPVDKSVVYPPGERFAYSGL